MKGYIIAGAVIMVLILSSLYYMILQGRRTAMMVSGNEVAATETPKPSLVMGPFKGVFPCADCSGLDVELTLTKSTSASDEGIYTLREVYEGKNVAPLLSSGPWSSDYGTNKDPNAVVYVLDPEKPEQSQSFKKINDSEILMLDKDGNEIEGPFNYTLKKQ